MSDNERELNIVREHCAALGEHFDTVQILCTRDSSDGEGNTVNISYGHGNWFARYGQAKEWLVKSDERTRQSVREEQ